ncbi:biotin-dependent carboxyltransferase family protein [Brevibacillus humidisoli]|uniref:5-oxoprolinase subunit C family protein n=1 Tax=Brevibacillus humidisoli TaxID=2895522 RepID=UPI003B977A92
MKQGKDVFRVKKPGVLTTVQDLGRTGYQQYGMVVAGAMDPFALQVGNLLVGNGRGEAGLEITLIGPELEILCDTVIAICGAELSPTLDGSRVPMWKSLKAKKGQTLRFGAPKKGARAYLTVAGGIDVPLVLGSKSTYMKAGVGGLAGRALQKGDILQQGSSDRPLQHLIGRGLMPTEIPQYRDSYTARVVLGPDRDSFLEEGITIFLQGEYQITQQADRMGYRLAGPKIRHREGADILSDAIVPGTIQVPANGEPIILLADRQTTGGYARIGTVISVDLPYIAQMLPGHQLRFAEVSIEEAHRLYVKAERYLRELSIACK